eukprot:s408_g13.t2
MFKLRCKLSVQRSAYEPLPSYRPTHCRRCRWMLCASALRMAGRVEKRVAELGLAIPEAAAPAANYVPWVRTGNNMLYISGQIPKQPDNSLLKGTLGATDDLVEEELEFSWQLPSSSEVAGIQRDHAGRVVKPDKKQREAVHGMSSMELLELLLQQVFLRAYADGLVAESFSLQQQIHEELWMLGPSLLKCALPSQVACTTFELGLKIQPAARSATAAAGLCALHLVGQMKAACSGDLDKVKKVVEVKGFVSSTPEFTDHPQVVNGCSDLLVEIFGPEVGAHSRFAVGCSSLPLGVAVEVGATVELEE